MCASPAAESEATRVARQIRDEIVVGVRPPGSKLVERDLADAMGVSRIPVRDALKELVAEGLVTLRPRSWATVREFTPSDIDDLNEVRSVLEMLAFKLAAQRRTRDGLARLQKTLDTEFEAARAGDAIAARRAAADFHEVVTDLSDNHLLKELEESMRSRLRWLLGRHDDLMPVVEEHQALLKAIEQRDVELIEELTAAHVQSSRERQHRFDA